MIQLDRETRNLPVHLNKDQVAHLADESSKLQKRIEDLEEQKAKVSKQLGDEIKEAKTALARLLRYVRTHVADLEMPCIVGLDTVSRRVHVIREDTGEVLETRDPTDDELQMGFGQMDLTPNEPGEPETPTAPATDPADPPETAPEPRRGLRIPTEPPPEGQADAAEAPTRGAVDGFSPVE